MQKQETKYRIVISGGGTGGHIYPALAIADELKRQLPDSRFLFVGANDKMEMTKVPKAGYDIKGLPITGIDRSFSFSNVLFPFRLIRSLWMARKIMKEVQPHLVIGTGGFASGPTLLAAQQKGLPTVIQEQNSLPGLTNKKLGKKAKKVFVAYGQMDQYFDEQKLVEAGNPVRAELFTNLPSPSEAKQYFDLNPDLPVVLSVGGSLGARTLNNVWKKHWYDLTNARNQLIWQTGKLDYASVSNTIKSNEAITVTEYIDQMAMAYAAADIIVSRAGAIAISELALVGKPIILVPYPYAAENHQMKNAKALEKEQAAIVIPNDVAENTLASTAINLLQNEQRRKQLAKNTKKFAKPNATETIVHEMLKLIES